MCTTCGCGSDEITVDGAVPPDDHHTHDHAASHDDHHVHDHHTHAHDHHHPGTRTVSLEQDILAKNQLFAERNRGWFAGREVLAVNLMSSPGAGKTSILERTIRELHETLPISVLEGDQATSADADRIRVVGAPVVQINTGTGCHLDAHMVAHGVERLAPPRGSVLLIENVGNLVCPALFDLGEQARVVIVSVTEGDDKPQKYPHMFRVADLLLINKIDLLPYVRFDMDRCIASARDINPSAQVLRVSAETGEGMSAWSRLAHQAPHPRRGGGMRLVPLATLLVTFNIAAWLWAWSAFGSRPDLLAIAFLAWTFGLRHAVDADHIAAIDNAVRKLMQRGERPIRVGLYFSLGHSTVVVLASIGIALAAGGMRGWFDATKAVGSFIGTSVSAAFLLVIALINLNILLSLWRQVPNSWRAAERRITRHSIPCSTAAASCPACCNQQCAWSAEAGTSIRWASCSGWASIPPLKWASLASPRHRRHRDCRRGTSWSSPPCSLPG